MENLKNEIFFVRKNNFKNANFKDLEGIIEKGLFVVQENNFYFNVETENEKFALYKLSDYKNKINYWGSEGILSVSFNKEKLLSCLIQEYQKKKRKEQHLKQENDYLNQIKNDFDLVKKFEKQNEMFLLRFGEIIHIRAIKCSVDVMKKKVKFYIESTTGSYGGRISFSKFGKDFFLTEKDALVVRKTLMNNQCPYCHKEIPVTGVSFCPFCGQEIIDDRDKGIVTIADVEKRYDLSERHIWIFTKDGDNFLYEGIGFLPKNLGDKKFKIKMSSQLNLVLQEI